MTKTRLNAVGYMGSVGRGPEEGCEDMQWGGGEF